MLHWDSIGAIQKRLMAPRASAVRSERDAGDERAGSLKLQRGRRPIAKCRVNPPESSRWLARRVSSLRCQGVGDNRIVHSCAVEDVDEVRPDVQCRSLSDAEAPAKTEILRGTALEPVIIVVGCRCSPLARGGLSPGRRIQYERVVRIEAVAVEILGEEWDPWNPIREAQCCRVPEQELVQVVLREWRLDRQTAGVLRIRRDRPAANQP
jgi:hypothetical protein